MSSLQTCLPVGALRRDAEQASEGQKAWLLLLRMTKKGLTDALTEPKLLQIRAQNPMDQ
jgi:hypothetical protein